MLTCYCFGLPRRLIFLLVFSSGTYNAFDETMAEREKKKEKGIGIKVTVSAPLTQYFMRFHDVACAGCGATFLCNAVLRNVVDSFMSCGAMRISSTSLAFVPLPSFGCVRFRARPEVPRSFRGPLSPTPDGRVSPPRMQEQCRLPASILLCACFFFFLHLPYRRDGIKHDTAMVLTLLSYKWAFVD